MARKVKDAVGGTTRISTKNQITIPVAALREAGLGPGDRLEVTPADLIATKAENRDVRRTGTTGDLHAVDTTAIRPKRARLRPEP